MGVMSIFAGYMGLVVLLFPSGHLMLFSALLGLLLSVSMKSWEVELIHEFFGSSWDSFGCVLVSLHYWLMAVVILAGWHYGVSESGLGVYFWGCVWILTMSVQITLSANCLFYLFIFFETSLLPVGLMILLWGGQPERLLAFEYMLVYGLCGGVPFFLGVLYASWVTSSWFYGIKEGVSWSLWVVGGCLMGGLVKLPIYGFHVWLPKAHVEASLEGSIILAGILLKLGGIQMYRLVVELGFGFSSLSMWLVSLGVWGGVFTSLVCFRQVDVKSIIAYSSVGHMGVVLVGVMMNDSLSVMVSLSMMVGHGFISCGMFVLASLGSEVVGSRSLYVMKGMGFSYPVLSAWWFLGVVMNMSLPPSLSFVSELGVVGQLLCHGLWLCGGLLLMVFLTGVYNLHVFSETQHGAPFSGVGSACLVLSSRSFMLLWCCFGLGVSSFLFMEFFCCC